MKKGKFLSVLTSLAMTSTMMLSALPFTAAAEESPVGLEMTADKTSFSLDEVKAGASTKVYVDVTTEFTQAAEVTSVEFCLKPDVWGVVDPMNLIISTPNQLSTDKGNKVPTGVFNATTTTTGSIWNKAIPSRLGYSAYNYADEGITVYADDYMPKATIMTDSTKGKLFTDAANSANHIAEFDVVIPTDAKEGTYTINFVDAQASVGVLTDTVDTMRMLPITDATPITITIGEGGTQPTTEAPTTEAPTTEATTPATTPAIEVNWNYIGTADLSAKEGVKAAPGDTDVLVPIYVDTHDKTIEGLTAKVIYDKSALTLAEFIDPYYHEGQPWEGTCGLDVPTNNWNEGTGVFSIILTQAVPLVNYPDAPIVVCRFEVSESAAAGTYPITFDNNRDTGKPIECVQATFQGTDRESDYLEVVQHAGSIVISGNAETEATTTKSPIEVNWNYIGTADLSAKEGVEAAPGDTDVLVPIYVDTHDKTIEGLTAKVIYNKDVLTLEEFIDPYYHEGQPWEGTCGLDVPTNNWNSETGVFSIILTQAVPLVNYPDAPIVVCRFSVSESAAAGTYPITFDNNRDTGKPIECVQATFQGTDRESDYLEVVQHPGSIVIGGAVSSEETDTTTILVTTTKATTTTVATTTKSSNTYPEWLYVGEVDLIAKEGVKAAPGDTEVLVPIYVDTHTKTIEGITAKVIYDKSVLKLEEFIDPYYHEGQPWEGTCGLDVPTNNWNSETGVFSIILTQAVPLVNYPDAPVVVCRFSVSESAAAGTYPITFQNNRDADKDIECVYATYQGTDRPNEYLEVIQHPGSIVIESTNTDEDEPVKTSVVTSISEVTSIVTSVSQVTSVSVVESQVTVTSIVTQVSDVTEIVTSVSHVTVTELVTVTSIVTQVSQVTEIVTSVSQVTEIVTVTSPVVVTSIVTNVEGVTSIITQISNVVVTDVSLVTSVSQVTEIVTVTSPVVVTSIVTNVEGVTSIITQISNVVVTEVSVVTTVSQVTEISVVTTVSQVTSINVVESQVTVTSIVTNVEGVTSIITQISNVTVTEIVTQVTEETEATTPVETTEAETTPAETTEAETTPVETTEAETTPAETTEAETTPAETTEAETTPAETTPAETTPAAAEVEIDLSALEVAGNDSEWYFADETAWRLEGVVVKVNGEVVEGAELAFSYDGKENVTPADVYNAELKQFDYVITVTYTDANGNAATGTFTAKIGLRGDANCDHALNVRDAAAIAKDLAQKAGTNKTTLTAENGFAIFLANVDCDVATGAAINTPDKLDPVYGKYQLNVRDAATIAKYLAQKGGNKTLTLVGMIFGK